MLPTDEMRGATGSSPSWKRGLGLSPARCLIGLSAAGIGTRRDVRDEAIAETVDGRDVLGRVRRVPERLPDLPHAHLQHGIAHDRRRPDGFEQRLLGDELAGALRETLKDREGLGSEAKGFRSPPEARVGRVQPERSEAQLASGFQSLTAVLPSAWRHVTKCRAQLGLGPDYTISRACRKACGQACTMRICPPALTSLMASLPESWAPRPDGFPLFGIRAAADPSRGRRDR